MFIYVSVKLVNYNSTCSIIQCSAMRASLPTGYYYVNRTLDKLKEIMTRRRCCRYRWL